MPGETGLQIDLTQFKRSLQSLHQRHASEAPKFIRQVGYALISAGAGYAPIDEGHLKASGQLLDSDKPLSVEIGFNTDYAAAVHERLELNHEQGQAKYFERAIREDGPDIFRKQAAEVARRLVGVS